MFWFFRSRVLTALKWSVIYTEFLSWWSYGRLSQSQQEWFDNLGGNNKTNNRNNALSPQKTTAAPTWSWLWWQTELQAYSKCWSSNKVIETQAKVRKMSIVKTLAAFNYILEVNFFSLSCTRYNYRELLYLRYDTCDCLGRIKQSSLVSLHECRPILKKLKAVHLLSVHHLVPGMTNKLKDRKWALTQPTKNTAYEQKFPV